MVNSSVLKSKVTLLVVPGDSFNASLLKFLKKIDQLKIGYITTNKGYGALVESFKKNNVEVGNFSFIDCITKTIVEPKPEKNCLFLNSPRSLTDISLAITKLIPDNEVIFLDSLSTLLIYNSPETLRQFVHYLANKIRMNHKNYLVMVISNREQKLDVFQQLEQLVDQVEYL